MAKKKKKQQQGQQFLSPEQFVKQRARSLEIGTCYITEDLENRGEGHIIVTRKHTGGRVSLAFFLVDIWCVGVKDSFYKLRVDPEELEDLIDCHRLGLRECSYEEAHNWIFGAVEFAEEAGIAPDKSFSLTRYMLEEDNDDIPLIEYDYGKNGRHTLVANSNLEASRYLPMLKKSLGEGNYDVIIRPDYEEDDWDEETEEDEEEENLLFNNYGPEVKYSYQHPDYPTEVRLNFPWIEEELTKPENSIYLKDELTDRILALPHNKLRENLENLILCHMGKTCDGIPYDYDDGEYNGLLASCVMLLAEVGNEDSSLNCLFEVMRQSEKFFDYHFGESTQEVFEPTLYKLAQHRLDKLTAFTKEEGRYWLPKAVVFSVVKHVALLQPARRNEALGWFREALNFCIEHVAEAKAVDATITAALTCDLVDMKAGELLPEINALFDTEMVELGYCGTRYSVIQDINNPELASTSSIILDIHERFDDIRQKFSDQ